MISKDKRYCTREGRPVRIYAVDGCGKDAVHGAVFTTTGWEICSWYPAGNNMQDMKSKYDLLEIVPRIKREYWVNVYADSYNTRSVFCAKESADKLAIKDRIACVKITIDCEEGEGL